MLNFENLRVYQTAQDYTDQVFTETNRWPRDYLYSLTDQLRRGALSITLNIAEGTSRTKKDFRHFLDLSRGSCYESIAVWELAYRRNLIDLKNKNLFRERLISITKMISGLKNSLK